MKIVIVEDEILIREGISKLLKNFFEKHEIVGIARNGKEGAELIAEKLPDLVITDIKMPTMDGLEMIEEITKRNIKCKYIILSAYEEFSYAKRALHWGVSEYLTKPLVVNELLQAVTNIEKVLSLEEINMPEVFGKMENILFGILYGKLNIDRKILDFLQSKYSILESTKFLEIQMYLGDNYDEKLKVNLNLFNKILENRKDFKHCFLQSSQERMMIVIIYHYVERKNVERWFYQELFNLSKNNKNSYGSCGIIEIEGIINLRSSHKTLLEHMDWNISFGDEILISYPKILQVRTSLCSYPVEIENKLKATLCSYSFEKMEKQIAMFIKYFSNEKIYNPKDIKESYIRLVWAMISIAKEISLLSVFQIDQKVLLNEIMQSVSQEELSNILLKYTKIIYEKKLEENQELSYNVKKAKGIISEYYHCGITLDEISNRLNLTPEYLGMQFHKETGIKFSTYIKEFKINKAKELLIGSNMKVMDIAKKVGYSEPKYFSKVFKESTGQLPAEYRKRNR